MFTRPNSVATCLAIAGLAFAAPIAVAAIVPGTQVLAGSVRLPDPSGRTIGKAQIVRALTPAELAAPMAFSVSLRMRDFAGLEARIAAGEQVSSAEMEARYLPLASDYERVASWLAGQGFTQTMPDRIHMNVHVRGPVAAIGRALGVQFARVAVSDGEYSSAISEPSLPADLAPVVLAVSGLQPEFRLRHVQSSAVPVPNDIIANSVYVTPDNVVSAYNIPAGATGAGQTIAVVDEAPLPAGDLASFFRTANVAGNPGNVTVVNVNDGPPTTDSSDTFETCLDVEWSAAIAPGAQIRLYLAPQNAIDAFQQIMNDLPSFPGMRVISTSYGNTEANDNGFLQQFAQTTAAFAAAGVSILASSGDAGSNPDDSISAGDYLVSAPLGVSYPASDPNVTGVGGTTVNYTGSWAYSGEIVWNQINDGGSTPSATGGGVSAFFPKPSWQTGGSLLAGETNRCVPDVSAISDADLSKVNLGSGFAPFTGNDLGVLIFQSGNLEAASGTSLSAPVWAAIAALINQARASAGLGSIGLLNPHLYPLAGTSAFNDITSGNNGFYTAGPGYDLCTGIGSPNVANLLSALAGTAPAQRLVNISSRAEVETGANILIAGFVVEGAAGTSKDVLVRGIGPALSAFSVSGVLANPIVGVYDSKSVLIASDTGWSNPPTPGSSTSGATFREATASDMAATGAFALTAGTADSAMVLTLPVGSYTVQVSGAGSTSGVALAEVYELDSTSPEVLQNISARSFVGTGSQIAISGFVVHGGQTAQLLIRGVGPALGGFGITGFLANPVVGVYDSTSTLIASNTGWGNAPVAGTSSVAASFRVATAGDMTSYGAFGLTAGSADSAMVITLPPGSYTAEVSGLNSTTGTVLAEVYEAPNP
jgi:kumamolisin